MLEGKSMFRIVLSPAGIPHFCHNFVRHCRFLGAYTNKRIKSIHLALAKLKCTFLPGAMLSHFRWMRGKIEQALWFRFRLRVSACSKINSKGKDKTTKLRNINDNGYLDWLLHQNVFPLRQ